MLRTPNTASARAKTVAPPRSVPTLDSVQATAPRRLRAISTWERDRRGTRASASPTAPRPRGRSTYRRGLTGAGLRRTTRLDPHGLPGYASASFAPARQRLRSLSEMPDLRLVPKPELDRLRSADVDQDARLALLADVCRLNALVAVKRAGSGHLGSTFSALDIVAHLLFDELDVPSAASTIPTETSSSRPRATTSPGCTRHSSRWVSCRRTGCSACAASAASMGIRTSACPGSRRAPARSGWASRRGVESRSPSASSAVTVGSSS